MLIKAVGPRALIVYSQSSTSTEGLPPMALTPLVTVRRYASLTLRAGILHGRQLIPKIN